MDIDKILTDAVSTGASSISLLALGMSLLLGFGLSVIIASHYKYFGRTLANRSELAGVIPFICLTTLLIITIVKSSLALSLGLVGALSIVRFRTPIKEPEELAYLFLAIAVGLGLGASQYYSTIGATFVIIILMSIWRFSGNTKTTKTINLWISLDQTSDSSPEEFINLTQGTLVNIFSEVDIGNLIITMNRYEIGCKLMDANVDHLNKAISEIRSKNAAIEFNFLDESRISGL